MASFQDKNIFILYWEVVLIRSFCVAVQKAFSMITNMLSVPFQYFCHIYNSFESSARTSE